MAIIEHLDGNRFDMSKYGIPILKIGPIDNVYDSENVRGRPGRNRTVSYHGVRKIQLKMLLQAESESHAIFLEEALAEIFDTSKPFYIYRQVATSYDFELPGQTAFQSAKDAIKWTPHLYKRWKVERINNDAIEWDGGKGKRVIELETVDMPYAETPYTSLELAASAKEWGNDMLAWGMGLDWDEDMPRYTFTSNEFTLKNLGNVEIDPRHMPLKITLKGHFPDDEPNELWNLVVIKNLTTGDEFHYDWELLSTDTLVLDGVNFLVNGESVIADTNKKLIRLAKGDNHFKVYSGRNLEYQIHSIQFEFPFYFLQ